MFKCDDCGLIFPEPDEKTEIETYEAWGYCFSHDHHFNACPKCGSYDIGEAPDEMEDDEE